MNKLWVLLGACIAAFSLTERNSYLFGSGISLLLLAGLAEILPERCKAMINFFSAPYKIRHLKKLDRVSGQYDPFRFEVVKLLERMGYSVSLPASEADLVIERAGVTYSVIVKPLPENERAGMFAVQEAFAAMSRLGTQGAMVITNREYDEPALELARHLGVITIGRFQLEEWMDRNDYGHPVGKMES